MFRESFHQKFLFLTIILAIFVFTSSTIAESFKYPDAWGKNGFNLVSQDNSGIELVFSINQLELEDFEADGQNYKMASIPGIYLPNDAGAPNLPGSGRFIALPQGAEASIEIIASRVERFQNIEYLPAPPILAENDDTPLTYHRDPQVYSRDAFYPESPVALSEISRMRGVDYVIAGITPFQYNPVTKELLVYRDLRVRVSYTGGNGHFGEDRLRSRYWEPILRKHLLNYGSLPEINFNLYQERDEAEDVEYLIITPDRPEFLAWADSIKKFRSEQGIITGITTLTEIGGNNASLIDDYIYDAYSNWSPAPAAILLLGDYSSGEDGIISPDYAYFKSDNVYADVEGSQLPEIAIARICARDEAELQTMVAKFLEYERDPPASASFYNHPMVASTWEDDRWFILTTEIVSGFWENELGKDPVREYSIHSGTPSANWSTMPLTGDVVDYFGPNGTGYIPQTSSYLTDWSGDAEGISNAIESGSFIVQHRDHGSTGSWSDPHYSMLDIVNLNNQYLPFVFSVNCLTGQFNINGECFAEKFHRKTDGALGLIAATEVSYSFVNDAFTWGIYESLWGSFDPNYGPGDPIDDSNLFTCFALADGKYYLAASSLPLSSQDKNLTYNLFHHHGDAFTTIYSEVPQQLTVSHPATISPTSTTLSVTATAGSFICIANDGEVLGTAEGTGSPVSITIGNQATGDQLTVTATKRNYFRYCEPVDVVYAGGAYLALNEISFEDENNNGQLEAGESANLTLTLRNVGNAAATQVAGQLICSDPYVTVTTGNNSYGSIAAGSSSAGNNDFVIEIAENVPNEYEIDLTLGVMSTTFNQLYPFSLTAYASVMGEFDIGGGNNDYPTLTAAVEAMNEIGISGDVIFNVFSGTYNGEVSLTLENIPELTGDNSVTFRAETGNNPVLTNSSGESIFHIVAADNITIQGFEIDGGGSAQYGIRIDNPMGTTDSTRNCIFQDNYIHDLNGSVNSDGILIRYGTDIRINNNVFSALWGGAGIEVWRGRGVLVYNNFLYYCGVGIETTLSDNCEYYYNSIYGECYNSVRFFDAQDLIFKNNVIYNPRDGNSYALYYFGSPAGNNIDSDYNDLYVPNGFIANIDNISYQLLSSYQNISGVDAHSVSADPNYFSISGTLNLHVDSTEVTQIGNAGTPISGIIFDFDGDARNEALPDMGADEFNSSIPIGGYYDIGGGQMDFATVTEAVEELNRVGMETSVTFTVYDGTYHGQVEISSNIEGLTSQRELKFQAAPGNRPRITDASGEQGCGFKIIGADNITIDGFEIDHCDIAGIHVEGIGGDYPLNITIKNNYIHDTGGNGNYYGVYLKQVSAAVISRNEIEGDNWGLFLHTCSNSLIDNNMIYGQEVTGLYLGYTEDIQVYYNSIFVAGGALNYSHTAYFYQAAGTTIKNNIFCNSGMGAEHRAITIPQSVSVYNVESDYNDLFAPNGSIAHYNGTDYTTLSSFQTATGTDAHSVSGDPGFMSLAGTYNLHIDVSIPSPVNGTATPLQSLGLNYDFDGNIRNQVFPDIGADEFNQLIVVEYDIGGGALDFNTLAQALDSLRATELYCGVTYNVYPGIYDGCLNLSSSEIHYQGPYNPLTIRKAAGETDAVVVKNSSGAGIEEGNIIFMEASRYITIEGLEITDCERSGIYLAKDDDDPAYNCNLENNYIHEVGLGGEYAAIRADESENCRITGNVIEGDFRGIEISGGEANKIINNMLYDQTGYGIYASGNLCNLYLYNSVLLNGSSALYLQQEDCSNALNNVLFNTGSGEKYALFIDGDISAYPISSNYNDLYAPNGHTGFYNSSMTTLAQFQSATGMETNSISVDPLFKNLTDTPDLHLGYASPCIEQGAASAEAEYDLDGDPRDANSPDMGADEVIITSLAGEYDIGGGNADFETIIEAVELLNQMGLGGEVVFNVYEGNYDGRVVIDGTAIPGMSGNNSLQIRTAPDESEMAVVSNSSGSGATEGTIFFLKAAENVTIEGLELTGCESNAVRMINSEQDSCKNCVVKGNYIHDIGINASSHAVYVSAAQYCDILGNEIDGDYSGVYFSSSKGCMAVNNMLYNQQIYGARIYNCENTGFYYNSVYLNNNSSTVDYALNHYNSSNSIIKDNILFNAGAGTNHYSFYITGSLSAYPLTSDYNDLYAPAGRVGFYNTAQVTLSNFQSATGLEGHSISGDPEFENTSEIRDLHVSTGSLVLEAGIPISGLTTDFDGEIRSASEPSIGADEVLMTAMAGEYDIGGGDNDYDSIVEAVEELTRRGMAQNITFNVFEGAYDGWINIDGTQIEGMSPIFSLMIRTDPSEETMATVKNTLGTGLTQGNIFYLKAAENVTIERLEIYNCQNSGVKMVNSGTDSCRNCVVKDNYIHYVGSASSSHAVNITNSANCQILENEIDGDYSGIMIGNSTSCLAANNMLYRQQVYGIRVFESVNTEVYYNSIYMSNSGTVSDHALDHYNSTGSIIKNNIFYNAGSGNNHYGYYIAGSLPGYPFSSDYNDIYAPNGRVGYYSGAQITLSNFQSATGLDAHSVSGDPLFVDATSYYKDLHIQNHSAAEDAGTVVSAVIYDADGDLRSPLTPDIGADEYSYGSIVGEFDVGGGREDFDYIFEATMMLEGCTLGGPVTINVYPGIYDGWINIDGTMISGMGPDHPVTFQGLGSENDPVIVRNSEGTGSTYGFGFHLKAADYITIDGFEIESCSYGAVKLVNSANDSTRYCTISNNYIHDVGTGGDNHAIFAYRAKGCQIIANEIEGDFYGIYLGYGSDNTIANNMLYSQSGYGINAHNGHNNSFYYNSVYMAGNYALDLYYDGWDLVENNILFNSADSGYAFSLAADPAGTYVFSNFNILYAPDGFTGYFQGDRTTLTQWQTATGLDSASIGADPDYLSTSEPYNLHISEESPAVNTGTSVPVWVDIDGEDRDWMYPCIGCDEIFVPGLVQFMTRLTLPAAPPIFPQPIDTMDVSAWIPEGDTWTITPISLTGLPWADLQPMVDGLTGLSVDIPTGFTKQYRTAKVWVELNINQNTQYTPGFPFGTHTWVNNMYFAPLAGFPADALWINADFYAYLYNSAGDSVEYGIMGNSFMSPLHVAFDADNMQTFVETLPGYNPASGTFYNYQSSAGAISSMGIMPDFNADWAYEVYHFTPFIGGMNNGNLTQTTIAIASASGGESNVTINWVTQTEYNSDYFSVYRNGDILGTVPAAGLSADPAAYEYIDGSVIGGIEYEYEVSVVMEDGSEWLYPEIFPAMAASSSAVPVVVISIEGDNVVLNWEMMPGMDYYSVYRGEQAYFIPSPENFMEEVSGNSFTDYGAVAGTGDRYYVVIGHSE